LPRSSSAAAPLRNQACRAGDRELEVFDLGPGIGTRQVAEALNVSIKTVQAYCARIKQKMQLATATELLRKLSAGTTAKRKAPTLLRGVAKFLSSILAVSPSGDGGGGCLQAESGAVDPLAGG
jgi:hypothetical protein